MANKVWKAFFEDGREVSARSSDKEPDICGVCGNDKSKAKRNKAGETVCEATERHCKESKKVQEGIMKDKILGYWNKLSKKAKWFIIAVTVLVIIGAVWK